MRSPRVSVRGGRIGVAADEAVARRRFPLPKQIKIRGGITKFLDALHEIGTKLPKGSRIGAARYFRACLYWAFRIQSAKFSATEGIAVQF